MSFTGNSAPQVKLETQSTDKIGMNKHMRLTRGCPNLNKIYIYDNMRPLHNI